MEITIIITSAVTASIVSGLVILLNGHMERRARRKETLFRYALDLAKERNDLVARLAMDTKTPATFRDSIFLAETYYKWLRHMYCKDELPAEAHEVEAKS